METKPYKAEGDTRIIMPNGDIKFFAGGFERDEILKLLNEAHELGINARGSVPVDLEKEAREWVTQNDNAHLRGYLSCVCGDCLKSIALDFAAFARHILQGGSKQEPVKIPLVANHAPNTTNTTDKLIDP